MDWHGRDRMEREIFERLIDYLNEPFNNGTDEEFIDCLHAVVERFNEVIDWYKENRKVV